MVQLYGLCSCGPNPVSVPLEGVHVEAKVVDMIAQVSVVQYYCNNSNSPMECKYLFPLDSYSAVCGFEAEINGQIIAGVVKEKTQAKREYNEAIARGDGAYLLEEQKEDIFEVSVGNVPPLTRVNIWITYITELKIEADESTRFLLPTAVAPRYTPPSEVVWHTPWYECCRRYVFPWRCRRRYEEIPNFIRSQPHSFSVMIEIEAPSTLVEVVSATHAIQIDKTDDNSAFVSFLHANEAMGRDFILDYKISDAHKPRAIIECENEQSDRVSAMVTLVPDFTLDDVRSELIFLVDRSGSMSGKWMDQAKDALQFFIRALPVDCYFNIIGFGSSYTKLYDSSRKYAQSTLNEATTHINAISANLGGTELLKPLQHIFSTKTIPGYARNVFVLTDGQVSNTEQVVSLIRNNSKQCRVFALGIGSSVSHALVEGMARAGKGNARFVVEGQKMDITIMRQLKDAIQPALTDIAIDWGYVVEEENVASGNSNAAPPKKPAVMGSLIGHRSKNSTPVPTPRKLPACYCQAPFNIPPIFSGTRFMAYAFLRRPAGAPTPRHITITAESPDGPLSIELDVEEHSGNLVQKLTARALIRDLEEGSSWLHSAQAANLDANVKSEIIRLGTTYSLASKHTSFIAIEPRNYYYPPPPPVVQHHIQATVNNNSNYYASPAPNVMLSRKSAAVPQSYSAPPPPPSYSSSSSSSFSSANYCAPPPPMMMGSAPMSYNAPLAPSSSYGAYPSGGPPGRGGAMPSMAMSASKSKKKESFSRSSKISDVECERKQSAKPMMMKMEMESCCDSLSLDEDECEDPFTNSNQSISLSVNPSQPFAQSQSQPQAVIVNPEASLKAIVMLQQFDGSFNCDASLAKALNVSLDAIQQSIPASLSGNLTAWASALVIAYFEKHLSALKDNWELMADKIRGWLRSTLKPLGISDVNSIISSAKLVV